MEDLKLKVKNRNQLEIRGYLKTLTHFDLVTKAISDILNSKERAITIYIYKSFSLNSSYILYFLDIVDRDIDFKLYVEDKRLFKSLKKLDLIKKLNISQL